MSIGTKFNLVALGVPVAALLVLLGLIYWLASNLLQPSLVLVGGFVALDGVVWNRLRTQVETKMHNVWDNYLRPISDSARVRDSWAGGWRLATGGLGLEACDWRLVARAGGLHPAACDWRFTACQVRSIHVAPEISALYLR